MHHSLGDGDFEHTARMSAEVSAACAILNGTDDAGEIDRVLATMIAQSRPGYLSIPADVASSPCTPPRGPLAIGRPVSDRTALRRFACAARTLLADRSPVVLADIVVHRAGAQRELDRLIQMRGLRYASLLWGRRVVDESGAGYLGVYLGEPSEPSVRVAVEGAPVLVTVGVQITDLISGGFSDRLDANPRIDIRPHTAVVDGEVFDYIEMRDALVALTDLLAHVTPTEASSVEHLTPAVLSSDAPLTQGELWALVTESLTLADTVFAEQGTSFYGMAAQRLPHGATIVGQPLWASIGYTLPAMMGAALAAPDRRPVLLIGDGAAQMTAAELGTIIRLGIPAVIVVVNNNGYTVERAIHGPTKAYNDIARWQWTQLPYVLGATPATVATHFVTSSGQLADALDDAAEHPGRLTLIEAVTAALDVPPTLEAVAAAAAAATAR